MDGVAPAGVFVISFQSLVEFIGRDHGTLSGVTGGRAQNFLQRKNLDPERPRCL